MSALKKERNELENAASELLNAALKAGAEEAEVCATYSHQNKLTLEKQDYHMASSDEGYNLGVRVLSGGRQGFASCNLTDPKDLKEVASRAVQIAGFSPVNPNYQINPSENVSTAAPTDLWDEGLHQLSLQTQKEWTKLLVDEVTKDPRFRLNEGTVTIASSLYLVINSKGTHKLEKETAAHWSLMGMGIEGDVITSFDYFSEMSRTKAQLPEKLVASAREFRERVLSNLRQGPTQSYKGLVVFSPRAVLDILLSTVAYHFNGRNVAEKTGRWNLEDLGRPLFNQAITFNDMPWLTDRTGYSLFDREGTPTSNQTIVDKGVLKAFFMDHYAAKALGRTSTGHAAGGPSAPPSVSSHNLCIAGGTEAKDALLTRATSQQKDFLLLHRYSGQADPVTGDFSGVAKGGEWWQGGQRSYSAKETLISGNVFEAFGNALFGLSKETEVVEASEESPTLILDGVSVTSA